MAKCKDGKKYVNVSRYQKKDGKKISSYKRSCPSRKTNSSRLSTCCVCEEEYPSNKIRTININGKPKTICDECVDTIHGLM